MSDRAQLDRWMAAAADGNRSAAIAEANRALVDALETTAVPRNREIEAAKARDRSRPHRARVRAARALTRSSRLRAA